MGCRGRGLPGAPADGRRFRAVHLPEPPPTGGSGNLSNDHRSPNRPAVADHVLDQPLAGLQVAQGEGVLRAEHLQAEARGRPKSPSGADDHGQGLLVERVRTEDVHPVPDERHPGAAFQEEPLRGPGPELRHGIEVRRADGSLRGVDRHPVHFGADVHARIDAISDIDQHGTRVAVREILLAGLTIAAQRRERAAGHEPHPRGAAGRLARRCLRGCLGERHGRGKREQAQAAHPGAHREVHDSLHVK